MNDDCTRSWSYEQSLLAEFYALSFGSMVRLGWCAAALMMVRSMSTKYVQYGTGTFFFFFGGPPKDDLDTRYSTKPLEASKRSCAALCNTVLRACCHDIYLTVATSTAKVVDALASTREIISKCASRST